MNIRLKHQVCQLKEYFGLKKEKRHNSRTSSDKNYHFFLVCFAHLDDKDSAMQIFSVSTL